MNLDILREEIRIQLELMDATVHELESLAADLASKRPTVREIAAAGAFLSDFYTGIENVLKRISRCYGIFLPAGDDWHAELFARFCEPGFQGLPTLFNAQQKKAIGEYRQFRHVVHHGYAMRLDWDRMAEGVENVGAAYDRFKARLRELFDV